MKILIGTPVHESKDYSMDRWIASVSKFEYSFDLLMVDNSTDPKYVNKLHGYCKKYGLSNYKLVHIDVGRDAVLDERLAQSREVIRREILDNNYDAWFSLECDVITPPNTLTKLVDLIDDYWMINHAYPGRDNPLDVNVEFGISLIKRKAIEENSFINEYGYLNPLRPNSWYGSDVWFIRRIDRNNKAKNINVYGIIKPIYHLSR